MNSTICLGKPTKISAKSLKLKGAPWKCMLFVGKRSGLCMLRAKFQSQPYLIDAAWSGAGTGWKQTLKSKSSNETSHQCQKNGGKNRQNVSWNKGSFYSPTKRSVTEPTGHRSWWHVPTEGKLSPSTTKLPVFVDVNHLEESRWHWYHRQYSTSVWCWSYDPHRFDKLLESSVFRLLLALCLSSC